jgi:adenosylhomocysteinase
MEGYQVQPVDDVVKDVDIFVTATGNINCITVDHFHKMKDKAIVGNIGHFESEIDVLGLSRIPGIVRVPIKEQYDMWTLPDGHSVLVLAEGAVFNLACATGHPSFVMSMSFTNQTLAQLEIVRQRCVFKKEVYTLSRKLDEEIARLHLEALGVKLTTLTDAQAKYMGVQVEGPFKSDSYRY